MMHIPQSDVRLVVLLTSCRASAAALRCMPSVAAALWWLQLCLQAFSTTKTARDCAAATATDIVWVTRENGSSLRSSYSYRHSLCNSLQGCMVCLLSQASRQACHGPILKGVKTAKTAEL